MMRLAYIDPFGGASGDMMLGALVDAGADLDSLNAMLAELGLGLSVKVERVQRQGLAACKATVLVAGLPADPGEAAQGHGHPAGVSEDGPGESAGHHRHEHTPGHTHEHRGLSDIEAIINAASLPEGVKEGAIKVFRRLAVAEAAVHGSSLEDVHFHEVGAADAIGDIVGTCAALHLLSVTKLLYGPIPTGGGTVRAAHGVLPVPAPATLQLLRGCTVWDPGLRHEMVTPTGAALLVGLGEQIPGWPNLTVEGVGIGTGKRDTERANILRAVIGTVPAAEDVLGTGQGPVPGHDQVILLETNLDDVTGQVVGDAIDGLLKAGALDAWWTACGMKKGRPGVVVSCLVRRGGLGDVVRRAFDLLPTLGMRYQAVDRFVLSREHITVGTEYGPVRVKLGRAGEQVFVATPEFEDCRAAAAAAGVPVRRVILAAAKAASFEPPSESTP